MTLGAATVVGLGLILLSVLALESVHKRLRDADDTEAALELPVLAEDGSEKANRFGELVLLRQEGAEGREDYLRLASALRLGGRSAGSTGFVVLITSIEPGDGTSDVLPGLGRALATLGQRVIGIDADLHGLQANGRPSAPRGGGLGALLVDPSFFEDQLIEVPVWSSRPVGGPSEGPHRGAD